MNPIEDRLRDALTREAEDRDVASPALLAATRARVPVRRSRRRTPVLMGVGAAAALVVVAGVSIGVDRLGHDEQIASDLAVQEVFVCPEQVEVDLSGAQDEFVPTLTDAGPEAVADENDAPRWRFEEDGDSARLYLGNADGTLGSIATYDRDGDGWALVQATACGNGTPSTPTADALRLGVHDTAPYPAVKLLATGDRDLEPVLVDDRSVYDYSGLVTRHRSLYVAPCGPRFCWSSGLPDSSVSTRSPSSPDDERAGLRDLSGIFFLPDDLVERDQPFTFLAVPDQRGATSFEASAGSAVYTGVRLADPSWGDRAVWVVLLPSGDETVQARLRAGVEVLSAQDIDSRDG